MDFVMCARNVSKGKFGNEPGATKFLFVPDAGQPLPDQAQRRKTWADAVLAEAHSGGSDPSGVEGHILFFVHGYNNSQQVVMQRHRRLKQDLQAKGFNGTVVSFDWPSADRALNYLEDRVDAKKVALQLVTDGIAMFAAYTEPDCRIATHILAHSMGALVVREAFDDADDRNSISSTNWKISQLMFIAADISSGSMRANNSSTDALYLHSTRVTNYFNRHDAILVISNVKRIGVAPRAGRIGLPDNIPGHAVDVDCSSYWQQNYLPDSQGTIGNPSHSWHIGDQTFTEDMLQTMRGVARDEITTRAGEGNRLTLVGPEA